MLRDLTLVGEKNETFFIRVWKLLPGKRGKPVKGKLKKDNIWWAWAVINGIRARHWTV